MSLKRGSGAEGSMADGANDNRIIFRDLPGIGEIENQYLLYHDNRLFRDERAALERTIDDKSLELFGITERDTSYWDQPELRWATSENEWEEHFDFIFYDGYAEEEKAFWDHFGIDVTNAAGEQLACMFAFGRQLVCALKRLHPKAFLNFGQQAQLTDEQMQAAAEAWGRRLLNK
jgi:hypothetical protein